MKGVCFFHHDEVMSPYVLVDNHAFLPLEGRAWLLSDRRCFLHDDFFLFSVERLIVLLDLHLYSFSSQSLDRKSTRLNSSHVAISYAVFCLKKKNKNNQFISYSL